MPQPRQVREEPSQVQRQHHSDTGQGAARARGGAKPPTAPFGRNGIATVQGGLSGSTRTPQLLQASHPLLAQPHASTTPLLHTIGQPPSHEASGKLIQRRDHTHQQRSGQCLGASRCICPQPPPKDRGSGGSACPVPLLRRRLPWGGAHGMGQQGKHTPARPGPGWTLSTALTPQPVVPEPPQTQSPQQGCEVRGSPGAAQLPALTAGRGSATFSHQLEASLQHRQLQAAVHGGSVQGIRGRSYRAA